jgi:uncharacterized membrane protein YdjX (TVP38/TMEM64 family)
MKGCERNFIAFFMFNQPKFKKILTLTWGLFLVVCIVFIFLNPEKFTPNKIAGFIEQFNHRMLFIYFLISVLRGLTLVPSTPFVLAGTILFPSQPWTVLLISIAGIIFSSTMIYYFSEYLGFGTFLENKYPNKIRKVENYLQKPGGFLFVFLWAFLPVLPTDLVCYVAGTLRMNFLKYILALTLGELILCSIYIFGYGYLSQIFNFTFG